MPNTVISERKEKLNDERASQAPRLAGVDLSEPAVDGRHMPDAEDILAMLAHPVVASAFRLLVLPVKRARLVSSGDKEQMTLLRDWHQREYESFTRLIFERALVWGWAAGEYQPLHHEGARLFGGLRAPHPTQSFLEVDEEGNTTLMVLLPEEIAVEESLVWMVHNGDPLHTTKGRWSDFSTSVLLPVWWAFREMQQLWLQYNTYLKRRGTGVLKVKYPLDRTGDGGRSANEQAAKSIGRNLRRLPVIPLPQERTPEGEWKGAGWDLEFTSDEDRSDVFSSPIERLERYIYQALGVPRKLVEQGEESGSFAMVRAQDARFAQLLDGYRFAWETVLWRNVWQPMLLDNFGSVDVEAHLDLWGGDDQELKVELLKMGIERKEVRLDYDELARSLNVPQPPTEETSGEEFETDRGAGGGQDEG